MKDILRVTWAKYITVAVENIPTSTVIEYAAYHGYPSSSLDCLLGFANWCLIRGFKTFIYTEREQFFVWKVLFKILIWMGIKFGKLSGKLIVSCP